MLINPRSRGIEKKWATVPRMETGWNLINLETWQSLFEVIEMHNCKEAAFCASLDLKGLGALIIDL